jgi:polysaccharide pyruvyl transferase
VIVEARPGSFINKGGELMMRAVVGELGEETELAVEPWIAPYRERARLGLLQKLWVRRLGPAAALPAALLPRAARRRFGIVGEDQIDAVLDASGFRYTDDDRYGARSTRELERNARRWRRGDKVVVLLPQALGPFRTPAVREPFLRALESVDLVYARDARSEAHLRELAPGDERIRHAPDVTIPLAGTCPPGLEALVGNGPFACLVPNDRMLERTAPEVAERYVGFLRSCAHEVASLGLRPVLVLHETARDAAFAERLGDALGPEPRVVTEPDPLILKGILGAAAIVVSSRYHALVSAMSQGVPVVATGWSHKYATLLDDFGTPGQLVDVLADPGEIRERLAVGVDGPERTEMSARLRRRAAEQAAEVAAMWVEIRTRLGLPVAGPRVAGRDPAPGSAT